MKHSEIVSKMTLEQKADFVSGYDYWHLEKSDELGLPQIMVTDGPTGLRKKNPDGNSVGLGNSYPATCFPTSATVASSWDLDLIRQEGEALGEECLKERVSVLLGPGVNIKRAPTCGRNFEYFSEDPYLSGKCAAAWINGVQSKGVGTSLKHFAANSQEAYRMVVNEVVDERAMRELYLTAFEIAVKEAQPWTIMNSYPRVNSVYASESVENQQKIARGEWGFDGLFMTDWGSSVDRVPGLVAGTDLEMPSSGTLNKTKIMEAVRKGELDEAILDERVDAVVDLILKSKPALEEKHTFDVEAHHATALKIAENSMQLLKNEDNILPLKPGARVAVIGEMAVSPRFQGAGSSVVNPIKPIENAFVNLKAMGVHVTYSKGYDKSKDEIDAKLFVQAVKNAKNADVAVVFAGLTEEFEGEGYDRLSIEMPNCHNVLISEVAKANPNTVVVLAGGSVVRMPWINEVKGLLNSGLGGQASGKAVAKILTGAVNPSGKTTETYPLCESDNPTYGNYPGGPVTSEHRESVYIGYRYYDTAKKEVLFPFGFGLSYTQFKYSAMRVSKKNIKDTDKVTVSFKIKNVGSVAGAEVAQLYVADKKSTIFRPEKELKAFTKVYLEPGEETSVKFTLSKRAFAFFNVNTHDWCVESGEFEILVGASSRDIKLKSAVNVEATQECEIPDYRKSAPAYYDDIENITREDFAAVYGELPAQERDPKSKIDIYCCLDDARETKWGGIICNLINKIMTGFGSDANGDGKMIAAMATQIPIRNFVSMSMGVFTPEMAQGLIDILNDDASSLAGVGKIIKGIPQAIAKVPMLIHSI
ncbi:MAG: glycoside hydrolase family 3 C-terminal domain-containing protein [Acutalibacteraceae bacterium]